MIGVVAVPFFLAPGRPTIEAMLDHIDYIARRIGWRHVGVGTDWPLQAPEDPDVQTEVVNLRSLGPIFDDTSSQLVSSAISLLNWHDKARFSAVDGSFTKPARASRKITPKP